jgi:hypothetical protein
MTIITLLDMGRMLNVDESAARDAFVADAVANSTTNGSYASLTLASPAIRMWSTQDSATAFIALMNTFTPAPKLAEVKTI